MEPKPAATLALLRRGRRGGLEVLLLKRSHRTRFIPGAYVFPGGRVDRGDLPDAEEAFLNAALRETFEETGILLTRGRGEVLSIPAAGEAPGSRIRRALHRGEIDFQEAQATMGIQPAPERLVPIGHWVTPIQEPYRYDTRFFATEVPTDCTAHPDGTELVEAQWLTPSQALELNLRGQLPLVFPTLYTLKALLLHGDPSEALQVLGSKEIPRLLPVVEKAGDGIRITLPDGPAMA